MKHLLYSWNMEMPVKWFDAFDKEEIKKGIIEHLKNNPTDTVEHCKEPTKNDAKKYVGYDIINFYKLNSNNEPCLIIRRGNKDYLKRLT